MTLQISSQNTALIGDGSSAVLAILAKADITSVAQDCTDLLSLHFDTFKQAELFEDLSAEYQARRPHLANSDIEQWCTGVSSTVIDRIDLKMPSFMRSQLVTIIAQSLLSVVSHYSKPTVIWSTIVEAFNSSNTTLPNPATFQLSGKTWAQIQTVGGISKLLISPPSNDDNEAFLSYSRRQIFQGWWRKTMFSMSAPLHTRISYIINAIVRENEDNIKAALLKSSEIVQLHANACAASLASVQDLGKASAASASADDKLSTMKLADSCIPSVVGKKVLDVSIFGCESANISLLASIIDRVVAALHETKG